ncbi:type I phosphomannose isomerase catalytic subunit [Exiguobacterium undae]|uniref:Mannose-6-phosphate isomerase n=1 Tax=Exiguobacterium undae TaxID=169177 RepID=A0ABX2V5K8_9BACL|nr:type I phosphomannose isomerase catalytic subunit [Exiguobacterium undae]OAN10394.1 hypothetical protein A3783_13675 [Exiguobacterium undae]
MYKIEPVFKERIWGGRRLEELFHFDLPAGSIGECWTVSAHPSGRTPLVDGPYQGQTLDQLWQTHRTSLFGPYALEAFPLHVKLLDSSSYLSVQVHPNDEDAKRLEGEPYGKNECWYILEAEEGAEVIVGHHLSCREELVTCAERKEWDACLRHQSVQKGDFIYIPSGTIHALGPGIVLLEIQQMSDRTYRLYDYDRLDADGNRRELHLEKAIAVTTIPDEPLTIRPIRETTASGTKTTLLEVPFFTVIHHDIKGTEYCLSDSPTFRLLTVVSGQGEVCAADGSEQRQLQKGDQYFIPCSAGEYRISGQLACVTSEVFPS